MYLAERSLTIMRGLLKRFGPSSTKKVLWDQEFSTGHWDFIDNTAGDIIYSYLEKYANQGSILDLGCGPGNTANELSTDAYKGYVGVDISEVALQKGRMRSARNGRAEKNRFELGDFLSYAPSRKFDVILFRESMYHVPIAKVKSMLDKYSKYLDKDGVFIVRMVIADSRNGQDKHRLKSMLDIIDSNFDVISRQQHEEKGPTVSVFRPLLNSNN